MARMLFYDVESLRNIFTVAVYKEPNDMYPKGHIDLFFISSIRILNFDAITQRIYQRNGNFQGTVAYHDLRNYESGRLFARMFGGLDDATAKAYGIGGFPSDIACQVTNNLDYLYYLCGYNSYNYDTTIVAWMMSQMFTDNRTLQYSVEPNSDNDVYSTMLTPSKLRDFNNRMFEDKNKMTSVLRFERIAGDIRKKMLSSGRHIDIARLNEKQSKVKRGFCGY